MRKGCNLCCLQNLCPNPLAHPMQLDLNSSAEPGRSESTRRLIFAKTHQTKQISCVSKPLQTRIPSCQFATFSAQSNLGEAICWKRSANSVRLESCLQLWQACNAAHHTCQAKQFAGSFLRAEYALKVLFSESNHEELPTEQSLIPFPKI